MKKFLKIGGIVVAVLLVLLMIIPFACKGKIEQVVKQQGNALLNAQFDFESLDISLLRHFPSASVSLHDFWIKGVGEFANDTLMKAGEVTATVNVMSLLGDGGYEIERVLIDNTEVNAIVNADGKVNWDVMKDSGETGETEEENEGENEGFRVKLEKLEIDGLSVNYDDRQAGMNIEIKDMTAECRGDLGSERTMVNLKAGIEALNYRSGGIALINGASVAAEMDVDADLKNGKFVLKENKVTLNAIELGIDGWVAMIDEGMDMDLKVRTNKVGFKEVLSLVPAIYAKDFDGLRTDGNVKLSAFAKGKMTATVVPEFNVSLEVKEGMFRYPSLPAGVENINIAMSIDNKGESMDATTVKVSPFRFSMGGNPFGVEAYLAHPVSNLEFSVLAKGKLDLGKIKEVYPMEDMALNGKVDADLEVDGCMKDIDQEKYENIKARGRVALDDMKLQLENMPMVDIYQSVLKFSPKYLELESTTVKMGDNDLTIDSRFENYMGYALKGTTLKGKLNVKSNYMNLNDFMSMSADTTAVEPDTAEKPATEEAAGVIVVPENIDFSMQTALKQVLLNEMKFNDVNGLLSVKNGQIDMKNLSMKTMGGQVKVNGMYATAKGKAPHMNAGFSLDSIVFAQAYADLGMVKEMAPIFEGLKGSCSGSVTIDADLDEQMSPVVATMKGGGYLATRNLSLSGVKFIDQVADIVKKPSLKEIKVKDLKIDFTVADGRVNTRPFDLNLGDCKMNLSGSTGLDQSIDYTGKISLPVKVGGKTRTGTVDMKIGGTFGEPKVGIDMESLVKNVAGNVLDGLLGGDSEAEEGEENEKKNVLDGLKGLFKKKK